jgi:hypothetical protein
VPLWLADIQTNLKEPLYMDAVHYNAKFSELIAARIATFLLEEIDSKQERCNSEISQARLHGAVLETAPVMWQPEPKAAVKRRWCGVGAAMSAALGPSGL